MMSKNDYDPNWWKDAKAQSLERKKAASNTGAGDSFLIVTEGTVSEPTYFDLLLNDLELSVVTVKVIPGDHSDPRHVIKTAVKDVKEVARRAKKKLLAVNELGKYDQVWAVIDTDVAVRTGIWNQVDTLAKANNVKLAHSTPCVEYWFLMHLKYTTAQIQDCSAAKSLVKHELGGTYSTNEKEALDSIKKFLHAWPQAVVHAEQVREHHQTAGNPIPANPSTEVDVLVRALNDSAPKHKRRL
jgi:hypothetical protein